MIRSLSQVDQATGSAMTRIVNMLDAKTSLSRLVQEVERGEVSEILIARNGKPAARLVPLGSASPAQRQRRIGVAKGRFKAPVDLDDRNEDVLRLFEGR